MKQSYSQQELDDLLAATQPRVGWDFSRMNVVRPAVPWDYQDVVRQYARPSYDVLDIGTGDGARLRELAGSFGWGFGIDADIEMVRLAARTTDVPNVDFGVCSARLEGISATFPLIINRHAPLDLQAIASHLQPGGHFITQQVGERNMACVRAALGLPADEPPITAAQVTDAGLRLISFREYDVEYVVRDIESLVFWLKALDLMHADLDGGAALASADALNAVLADNVDGRGFVTNEHRYLVVAQLPA
jgi:SAM-dependent methyltransferase